MKGRREERAQGGKEGEREKTRRRRNTRGNAVRSKRVGRHKEGGREKWF